MRSLSHTSREEDLEERSGRCDPFSQLASVGSSTTDGCVIKAKASFATKDLYDQCDRTMARGDAIIPPISGTSLPICYADGKIPSHMRDAGSGRFAGVSPRRDRPGLRVDRPSAHGCDEPVDGNVHPADQRPPGVQGRQLPDGDAGAKWWRRLGGMRNRV